MAKVSLSISGVQEGMSSAEVQQKLARLYGKPEAHFEKVSQSLFIMQQPYDLLKDVEQEVADKHAKRLTALGFQCDFGDGGLTLVPTADTSEAAAALCPSCEQECGTEETCQHCGVFMQKFLKQKKIDEQLQKQLQSASNSHERIQKFQAEQAEKSKELAKAKQKARLEKKQKKSQPQPADENEPVEAVSTATDDDSSDFKATYKEKANHALYGALAATVLVVGGGGYFAHDRINNRYVSDAPDQIAEAPAAPAPQGADTAVIAAAGASAAAVVPTEEIPEVDKTTIFDKWADRKRDQRRLKNQIRELVDENMMSSAAGLVAGKTDPTEQVFGRQELMKLEGESARTDRQMLSIYMLVLALENDADRVAATLNQSSIYRGFNRHDDATKTYDQAAKIAASIEDSEQRILSETAIAEHQVEFGSLDGARARYQAAKDRTGELSPTPELKTAALSYVASSEVAQGLTGDAEITAEQISDPVARQQSLEKIAGIANQNETSGVPELAAGKDSREQTGTGDELIDDLVKMNEQNKKKLEAASSLLGQ